MCVTSISFKKVLISIKLEYYINKRHYVIMCTKNKKHRMLGACENFNKYSNIFIYSFQVKKK